MHKFLAIDVLDITLLSLEEAKALPKEILACGHWWWLRSPCDYAKYVARVRRDGSVDELGSNVFFEYGIRPAFRNLNLKSSNLKFGDVIVVAGTEAIVISDDMALAKEPVGNTCFREDWRAEDANDYETSDVKKWLDDWWQKMKC